MSSTIYCYHKGTVILRFYFDLKSLISQISRKCQETVISSSCPIGPDYLSYLVTSTLKMTRKINYNPSIFIHLFIHLLSFFFLFGYNLICTCEIQGYLKMLRLQTLVIYSTLT